MNDEQYLLASAYVDGEATADERARAEADAEIMDEVTRMRAMQAVLADVEPAPAATRTAMLAAAMAEFGQASMPAAAATEPPAAPAVIRPVRKRSTMWPQLLSAAAAVVAVVAVGGVLASQLGSGGGDDDSADMSAATVFESTASDLARTMDSPASDAEAGGGDTDAAGTSEISEVAPAAPAPEATEAPAATAAAGTVAIASMIEPIENLEQLAQTGAELFAAPKNDGSAATAPADCTFAEALAAAKTSGDLDREELDATAADARVDILEQRLFRTDADELVDVYVAVDLESGQTYAIDTDCVLIAIAPAPAP